MAEQSNTGRNLLIAGIVLGIAAGGMGVYTMSSSKVSKLNTGVSNPAPAEISALTEKVDAVNKALAQNFTFTDVAPKGAKVNGKPRFTPLFYSPELWQVAIDQKNVVMDIYDAQAPMIHGNIPNSWFIENGLQDVMGLSNALTLDSDGDGFTNAEEHAAHTNPMDNKSFPALVATGAAKMEVVKVIREKFVIQVDAALAFDENPQDASIQLFRKATDAAPAVKTRVKVNESFGMPGSDNRFTVLGFERKTYHDSMGGDIQETALKVRDNMALTGEKEFVIRAGKVRPPANGKPDKDAGTPNEKGRKISDSSAVLRVTAGPKAGTPEGTFTVAEKATFKVPGAESVVCTLESIDDAGSVNIHMQGAESAVNVLPASSAKPANNAPAAEQNPSADTPEGAKPEKAPAKDSKKGKKGRK